MICHKQIVENKKAMNDLICPKISNKELILHMFYCKEKTFVSIVLNCHTLAFHSQT